jgi:hypothetical protein
MRSAVQLVSARDYRDFRGLMRPGREAGDGGLSGADPAEIGRIGRAAVEEQPRTIAELGTLLAERWPDADPRALTAAVRAEVALVQVPPHALWGAVGQPSYTSAEHWLGPASARPMSAGELVLRYLAAYGPATVHDMQAWSGLTRLQEVTDRLGDRLVAYRGEDGGELLDLPDAPLPDPDVPAPACFIPEFDNILQSHADRSRIMFDEDGREIFRTPGIVPGTVLVDGFVRGIWKITHHKGAATIVVRPLAQIPTRDVHALTEEGLRLLHVAAADATSHDVKFNSR